MNMNSSRIWNLRLNLNEVTMATPSLPKRNDIGTPSRSELITANLECHKEFEQPCWDTENENVNGAISISIDPLIHHDGIKCKGL
jgi:hypothetical protein